MNKINDLGKSDIVCSNVLNQIIEKGRNKIKNKRIIQKYLVPYIARAPKTMTTQILIQDKQPNQKSSTIVGNPDSIPNKIVKDEYTSKSVPKMMKNPKKMERKGSIKKSRSRSRSIFNSQSGMITQRLIEKENKLIMQGKSVFVEVGAEKSEKSEEGAKIEEIHNEFREQINIKQKEEREKRQFQQQYDLKNLERMEASKKIYQSHTRNADNKVTFDIDGRLIPFSIQNQKQSLKKKYPPAPLFSINKQRLSGQFKEKKQNQKMKAAKGEGFSSAILNTVNITKVSINSSGKEEQKNVLKSQMFNNNQCRQVTSIPYFKPKPGTTFTQVHNSQSIKNEETEYEFRESLSSKVKFRRFGRKNDRSITEGNFFKSNKIEKNTKTTQVTRVKTAGASRRPKTGRTSGHITTVNESLVVSLLE